jgi:ABC-type antimicrobial peptide transport system permease subunit
VLLLVDYQPYRYAVYLIPSFTGNFFNLNSFSLTGLIAQGEETSRGLMFAEGMLSYLFFGIVNMVLGLLLFKKRDIN